MESISTEWKAVYKRGRSHVGKTAWQSEGVMWTELSVGKYVSHVPGKAAIVHTAPVRETDTGGGGENPKADGRSIVKELGKIAP